MASWSKEEIEIVGGTKVSDQMPIIVPLDDTYSADRALTKTAQGIAPKTMEKGDDKTVVKKEDAIVAILADNPSAT